jgi:hypothetical protein
MMLLSADQSDQPGRQREGQHWPQQQQQPLQLPLQLPLQQPQQLPPQQRQQQHGMLEADDYFAVQQRRSAGNRLMHGAGQAPQLPHAADSVPDLPFAATDSLVVRVLRLGGWVDGGKFAAPAAWGVRVLHRLGEWVDGGEGGGGQERGAHCVCITVPRAPWLLARVPVVHEPVLRMQLSAARPVLRASGF